MTSKKSHCFPDSILPHEVEIDDGMKVQVTVAPSETFGHALARRGISEAQVRSVSHRGPIWYEADYSVATR